MNRRSLLVAGAMVVAGCAAPSPPTTDSYPSTPPNFVGVFDWLPDGSAYRVRFDAGNIIHTDDAVRIAVLVGEPKVDRRDLSVPAAELSETPGYRLVYRIETRFDRYGEVTVGRPPGVDVPLETRLDSVIADRGTY